MDVGRERTQAPGPKRKKVPLEKKNSIQIYSVNSIKCIFFKTILNEGEIKMIQKNLIICIISRFTMEYD